MCKEFDQVTQQKQHEIPQYTASHTNINIARHTPSLTPPTPHAPTSSTIIADKKKKLHTKTQNNE
jgi:hypothetical protein